MRIENIRAVGLGQSVSVTGTAGLLADRLKNRTALMIQNAHASTVLRVGSLNAITNGYWIEIPGGGVWTYYGSAPLYAQSASGSITARLTPVMGVGNSLDTSVHSQVAVTSTRTKLFNRDMRRVWTSITNVGATAVSLGNHKVLYSDQSIRLAANATVQIPGGAELWAIATGTNEVQTLTFSGSPSAGSYYLSFMDYTATLPFDANNAAIQAALEANPAIGVGNVTVTGSGPYTITFVKELAAKNVDQIAIDNEDLTGGTGAMTTATPGSSNSVNLNIRQERFG